MVQTGADFVKTMLINTATQTFDVFFYYTCIQNFSSTETKINPIPNMFGTNSTTKCVKDEGFFLSEVAAILMLTF